MVADPARLSQSDSLLMSNLLHDFTVLLLWLPCCIAFALLLVFGGCRNSLFSFSMIPICFMSLSYYLLVFSCILLHRFPSDHLRFEPCRALIARVHQHCEDRALHFLMRIFQVFLVGVDLWDQLSGPHRPCPILRRVARGLIT